MKYNYLPVMMKNIIQTLKDNYKIGEQTYYYPIDNINTKLKYLMGLNIITKEGNFNIVSGHDPEKTEIYLSSLKNKYLNIKIERLF